jgi:hypothetical protein
MATGSNTNDGGSAPGDGTSHLILQAKDGVGKSRVASWLTEFLISRGQVRCIDGDLVNRSVSQYKTLGARNCEADNGPSRVPSSAKDLQRGSEEETLSRQPMQWG